METPHKHFSWSHWDRFLFIILGLVLTLVLGLGFWFHELDKTPNVSVPTPAPLADNAFGYYKAAAEAVTDGSKVSWAMSRFPPGQKPSGDQRNYSPSEKAALVTENAGAVEILHVGFQYHYQNPPARSFSATFPQYQEMRGLARLLSLRAQVQAAQGDWNGAINSDLDSIQMGEEMPHGGPVIGMLVGTACQSIGRRPAWNAVDHLTAAQAKAAAGRLERIRAAHASFSAILQEEEWEGQASLLELMRARDWPGNLVTVSNPDGSGDPPSWEQRGTFIRIRLAGKRPILANYTRYMDQGIANARLPYAAHPADPPIPTDPVSQILLPVFSGARLREVEAHTQNALLLTELALRAYKLEHGTYPAALRTLAPTYLKTVPDDPFALSGPLRYRRTAGGYLLYSIGPDGKDDGGKPIFDATKFAPSDPAASDQRYYVQPESRGDVVAGVNVN